jgi:hypothetical protein
MTALRPPSTEADAVVQAAAGAGFELHHYETSTGQIIWEWRRGDDPRPQFVNRRVALRWMTDWLGRDSPGP